MENSVTANWPDQKRADLMAMVKNGSMVEAMRDEFDLTQAQLKDAIEELKGWTPPEVEAPHPPSVRTSEGLRDSLFSALDGLMGGTIDPNTALAACAVSQAICKTVELEMRASQCLSALGRKELRTLALGSK